MSKKSVRWGILGTGSISKKFAAAFADATTGKLVAVASRTQKSADSFVAHFPGVKPVEGYEALLADPEVDAVYIATPHPQHAKWAVAAADAGKHILCEKPITLNHGEAMAVAQAAQEAGVFLMEAFMVRCHPQTAKLVELLRAQTIGDLQIIQTGFSFAAGFNPNGRLFSNELGGGGILDVGCYPMAMSRLLAGAAAGKAFKNPIKVRGVAKLNAETGTDEFASAVLEFPGGVVAEIYSGIRVRRENSLTLIGTEGSIEVKHPWVMTSGGSQCEIIIHKQGGDGPVVVDCGTAKTLYALEIDVVGEALAAGQLEAPAMPVNDTLGNMAALDAWRESVGLTYRMETPSGLNPPLRSDVLRVRAGITPHMGDIEGLNKKVSRLIIGCDNQQRLANGAAIWDDYFERGGNAFDTAHIYGGGHQERLLGQWIHARGVRDQVVTIVKGAHTPDCDPASLKQQFETSLDRLKLEHADIYMMHRDNLEIPVGEFVDVMHAAAEAGLIGVYGGSNWSRERVDAANDYATKHGKRPFSVLSNNFSLASMVAPVWDGCISASDPDSMQWLKGQSLALLAWSSQARGFFLDATPDTPDGFENSRCDSEQIRCWHSPENFERRRRVAVVAQRLNLSPVAVAASYVLSQPFQTFALIGPRAVSETADSFHALGVKLTPEDLAWLNLESDAISE